MNEIFSSIWEMIALLVWSDWLTLTTLLVFLVLGFKRGLSNELINLIFLILTIFIAWLFYERLSNIEIINWLTPSRQSHLAIAFGAIFIGVIAIKRTLYKLIDVSSNINNPCVLNRFFAISILLIITALISWSYVDSLANLGVMKIIFNNNSLRISASFAGIFTVILGVTLWLTNILNVSIGTSAPCRLSPLFQTILNGLRRADIVLNARNIDGIKNKIWGAIVGLFKGCVFIVVMVLVLQSIDFVSQGYYWVESRSLLSAFQDMASSIQPELSQHLLFIKNE
ncbi:MAG: CvpA family protein [Gammaproteobacteria bacterium]|nr:CvpA family protein [Gammaproteobacteria bacterium]